MRGLLLTCITLFACARVDAGGLDDLNEIDVVRVSHASHQAFLYLVLDPGQLPQDQSVLEKVRKKLNSYRSYVTSGELWSKEANADRKQPVVLTVVVTEPLSPQAIVALESLRAAYDLTPTSFAYEHFEPKSRR